MPPAPGGQPDLFPELQELCIDSLDGTVEGKEALRSCLSVSHLFFLRARSRVFHTVTISLPCDGELISNGVPTRLERLLYLLASSYPEESLPSLNLSPTSLNLVTPGRPSRRPPLGPCIKVLSIQKSEERSIMSQIQLLLKWHIFVDILKLLRAPGCELEGFVVDLPFNSFRNYFPDPVGATVMSLLQSPTMKAISFNRIGGIPVHLFTQPQLQDVELHDSTISESAIGPDQHEVVPLPNHPSNGIKPFQIPATWLSLPNLPFSNLKSLDLTSSININPILAACATTLEDLTIRFPSLNHRVSDPEPIPLLSKILVLKRLNYIVAQDFFSSGFVAHLHAMSAHHDITPIHDTLQHYTPIPVGLTCLTITFIAKLHRACTQMSIQNKALWESLDAIVAVQLATILTIQLKLEVIWFGHEHDKPDLRVDDLEFVRDLPVVLNRTWNDPRFSFRHQLDFQPLANPFNQQRILAS